MPLSHANDDTLISEKQFGVSFGSFLWNRVLCLYHDKPCLHSTDTSSYFKEFQPMFCSLACCLIETHGISIPKISQLFLRRLCQLWGQISFCNDQVWPTKQGKDSPMLLLSCHDISLIFTFLGCNMLKLDFSQGHPRCQDIQLRMEANCSFSIEKLFMNEQTFLPVLSMCTIMPMKENISLNSTIMT